MKIMTYNIQHCRNYRSKKIEFDKIAAVIKAYDADVVGLNEVRGQGEAADYQAQAQILAKLTGYHYYFAKAIDVRGANPYGNAILSRYPILSAQTVMIPDPAVRMADNDDYETRCLLKAYIDIPGGLCVCVTHFGLNPDEQENAVQTVLEQTEQKRCVLMGDFNVTPENPLLDALREKMTDTGELLAPGTCSYPSDAPDIKIDYMFISKDLKAVSAEIPDVQESDHRPYVTVLEA